MGTIKFWPQWLTFLNIPHGDLLPCKFEWRVQNFSFLTLFDSYRELLLITTINQLRLTLSKLRAKMSCYKHTISTYCFKKECESFIRFPNASNIWNHETAGWVACVASVPVRAERNIRPREGVFTSGSEENGARAKRAREGGGGGERSERPQTLNSEKTVRSRTGLLIGAAWLIDW